MSPDTERLRLLYSDLHGLERGKYLLGDWAARGGANFCVGVWPLTFDREILPIPGVQFDVGLPDLEAHIDLGTLRPSWEPDTVIAMADTVYRGAPHPLDCREALRQAVKPWTDRGLIPQLAYEFEFYLLRPGENGRWLPEESLFTSERWKRYGSVTVKVLPRPSALSSPTAPRCSSTNLLTSARPSPVPSCWRATPSSACRNSSKTSV